MASEPAAEEPAAELRQYYDTYYDVYWRPFERPDQRAPRKVEMLLRQHVYPGARCLDVGCGDGRAGTVVTGCGGAYIGVDIDPHIRFFNAGALRRLLTWCGFQSIRVGGHSGSLLGDLPWMGRRLRAGRDLRTSSLYRVLETTAPSLFGCFLFAVARKPDD